MFNIITSKDNPLIKQTSALLNKKGRDNSSLFLFEGAKLTYEALESGIQIKYAFFDQSIAEKYFDLAERLAKTGAVLYCISPELMKKISDSNTPQGIVCVAKIIDDVQKDDITEGRYIALEKMQDPGNLGAVLRIADAFNLDGIIVDNECADIYSPKTIRGSMGSAFRVKVIKVNEFGEALRDFRAKGFIAYAADLDERATPVNEIKWIDKNIVVIGNEGAGVSKNILSSCGNALYIPMKGKAQSLNASVAAGIIAYAMNN